MTATRASSNPSEFESVGAAVERITRDAWTVFVVRWNWKAAVVSAAIRGVVYAIALVRHPEAVLRGAEIEMVFRVVVGGCWGSLAQALRNARPAWLAGLLAAVVLPAADPGICRAAIGRRDTPENRNGRLHHLQRGLRDGQFFSYAAGPAAQGRRDGHACFGFPRHPARLGRLRAFP
jgi:hypothetical protein